MPATSNSKIAGSYQRLSLAGKQALQRERMREPAVTCPVCETQTTAADLLDHIATRCPGPREPNPASKWVTWRQALAIGVLPGTMSKWVKRGLVHVRGELQDRRYLLRDIAVRVAAQRCQQRRQFPNGNRPEGGGSCPRAELNSDGSSTSGTAPRPGRSDAAARRWTAGA